MASLCNGDQYLALPLFPPVMASTMYRWALVKQEILPA